MEEKCLSHLLPYDTCVKKHGCLKKSLSEYQALLRAVLEAARYFQIGNLEKFDSLVGENACEIRAIWMAIIALKNSVNVSFLNDLASEALSKVDLLLNPASIDLLMRSEESLNSLLKKERLDIS